MMSGRMSHLNISPLSYKEYKNIWTVKNDDINEYLMYGSFPKSLYNYTRKIFKIFTIFVDIFWTSNTIICHTLLWHFVIYFYFELLFHKWNNSVFL